MDNYGKQSNILSYLDTTWKNITSDIILFSTNYNFNIKDEIPLKDRDGKQTKLFKGHYHKFEITYHLVTKALFNLFLLASSKSLRFYPHAESSVYYTVNMTELKPFYIKDISSMDGLKITLETDCYQNLEQARTAYYIGEAWRLNSLNQVGINGVSYTKSGETLISGGKFGACMELANATTSYIQLPNTETGLDFTISSWCKLPFVSSSYGTFLSLGLADFTNISLELKKTIDSDVDNTYIAIMINGTNQGIATVPTSDFFHIIIDSFSGQLGVWINGVFYYRVSFSTKSTAFINLGKGAEDKNFNCMFSETIINKNVPGDYDLVPWWYNSGLGREFQNTKYYIE